MKYKRSWLSLLGYCVLTALGAALILAMIFAAGSVALAGHQAEAAQVPQSSTEIRPGPRSGGSRFRGMITCSRCRARHMRNSHLSSTECARACVRAGSTYVLVDGDRSYVLIGGDEALSKFVGQRANVVGMRQGDAILVDSANSLF